MLLRPQGLLFALPLVSAAKSSGGLGAVVSLEVPAIDQGTAGGASRTIRASAMVAQATVAGSRR